MPTIVKIGLQPAAHFKMSIKGNGNVAQIKQAMNSRSSVWKPIPETIFGDQLVFRRGVTTLIGAASN